MHGGVVSAVFIMKKKHQIRFDRSREEILRAIRRQQPLADGDQELARELEERSGIMTALPMECRGTECPIASRCPVSHRPEFVGTPCILQAMEAYSHFRDYVVSLQINPTDYTDLQMVVDLVRTHVLSWWIDQLLAVEGIMQENTSVSGKNVSRTRVAHPLLAEQRALMQQRNQIYKELMASRRARLERESMEGKARLDFARMLAQVANRAGVLVSQEGSHMALPAGGDPSTSVLGGDDSDREEPDDARMDAADVRGFW